MKMKYTQIVIFAFCFSFLSLEAGPYRKYQKGPKSFRELLTFYCNNPGGYIDHQVSNNEFIVTYVAGDDDCKPLSPLFHGDVKKNIHAHALHRASELSKIHGFKYFNITDVQWGKRMGTPVKSGPYLFQGNIVVIAIKIECFCNQPARGGYCVR